MRQSKYKEFDDAAFTSFRKRLMRSKGNTFQRALLSAVLDGNQAFASLIRSGIQTDGDGEVSLFSQRFSEREFVGMPASAERGLYINWSSLPRRIACRASFWGHLTTRHIEQGLLNPEYLAGSGNTRGGRERIEQALASAEESAAKMIDDCVRSILRRLSGLPEARGNKSVYTDCPFARAWWREKMVGDIGKDDNERAYLARQVLRINQSYWETLIVMIVSRNSSLGSENVLHALILSLADLFEREPKSPLKAAPQLRLLCRSIGAAQAARELSILDESELRDMMDELVIESHSRASRDAQPMLAAEHESEYDEQ